MLSDPEFRSLTRGLRELGGQRVWSLMVSLFGDLAQDAAQTIDGPVLSAMMALLEVKPEATRVALHRLRNDGWIISEKSGRISRHQLTDKGRAESAAASPRIYAEPDSLPTTWRIFILSDGEQTIETAGLIPILPRVFIGSGVSQTPADALRLSAKEAPEWLKKAAIPQHLTGAYSALSDALTAVDQALPPAITLSGLQTAVLRGLIVHNWRRLVLKHPVIPQPLQPDDWPGQTCHVQISSLLTRFPRPALDRMASVNDAP